ncbi:ABC multidrug transporter B [Exophiala dermatitidis]
MAATTNYNASGGWSRDADDTFWALLPETSGLVDFTLLFEEAILVLGPLALGVLLLSIQVAWKVWKRPRRKLRGLDNPRSVVKAILYVTLIVLQLTTAMITMLLQTAGSIVTTKVSDAAGAVSLACAFLLAADEMLHEIYSLRSSALSQGILGWWALTDIVMIRSRWLRPQHRAPAALATVLLVVKISIIVTEELSKRPHLMPQFANSPPEALSSIYNRFLLLWVNPLMKRGLSGIPITLAELWEVEKQFSSTVLTEKMDRLWERHLTREKRPPLWLLLVGEFRWLSFLPLPMRVAQAAFQFAQPFLIQRTLTWFHAPVDAESNNVGYGLLGAFAFVYIGIAVTTAYGQYQIARLITALRGSLVLLIYRKTLDVKEAGAQDLSSITLMSTDVERIVQGLQFAHEAFISFFTLGLSLWLLERQLGVAAVAPIGVTVFSALIIGAFGSNISNAQKRWLEAVERRVAVTTRVLTNMKNVKMLGLADHMAGMMEALRTAELNISLALRRWLTMAVGLSFAAPNLSPVLGFGIYIAIAKKHGDTLLNEKAFTALSYFNLVNQPLNVIIQTLPAVIAALAAFDRIDTFLKQELQEESNIGLTDDSKRDATTAWLPDELDEKRDDKKVALVSLSSSDVSSPSTPEPVTDQCISIVHCTVHRAGHTKPALNDITVQIAKGSITMVVGPSGSGKTTLMECILGEISPTSGSIVFAKPQGSIAYCSQIPWLRTGSVRENVLNGLPYEAPWFQTVMRACTLDQDFGNGADSSVGHVGNGLSGGQRQKVALARAIYSRRHILVIDEPFTGIDSRSREVMVDSLLGPNGLFRQLSLTVIITSHSAKYLSHADLVVALDSKGNVIEQGPFQAVQDLTITQVTPSDTVTAADKQPISWSTNPCAFALDTREDVAATTSQKSRRGELEAYKYYFASLGWWKLSLAVLLVISFVFFTLFPQIWLAWWTSFNVKHPNQQLGRWLGPYAAYGFLAFLSLAAGTWLMLCDMVVNSAGSLHSTLVKAVQRAPLSVFWTIDPGVTVNRFSQDMSLVDMELPMAFANTVIIASKYLAAVIPAILALGAVVQQLYIRTSRQLRFLDIEAKAPLYTLFIETYNGLASIRAFRLQSQLNDEMAASLDVSQKPFYLLFCIQRYLGLVLNLMVAGLALLLIGVSIATRGHVGTGFLGVALINLMTFGTSLTDFVNVWCTLEINLAAVERVKSFSEQTPQEKTPTPDPLPPNWPENGSVRIEGLSVSYGGPKPALQEISLTIGPGEKVAICGRSGSGKTSLCLSLFKLLEPAAGSITIAGHDIAKVEHERLRDAIAAVTQDPFLLRATLRSNLDPKGLRTDQEIIETLQDVDLWSKFDHGDKPLDTEIDPDHLSFGEKQKLCLCRALLKKSKLLVLDEATSGVDQESDQLIHRLVCHRLPETTVISVMHRLDQINLYDRVVLLADGRIAEDGKPRELLKEEGSLLYDLHLHGTED